MTVAQILVVATCGIASVWTVLAMRTVRRRGPASSPAWRVVVEPAAQQAYDYDYGDYGSKPVEGYMAIALRRGRGERMPIAVLRVADADFQERLEAELVKAEDRAAVLNAYA